MNIELRRSPEETRQIFPQLKTIQDVADLLEIAQNDLIYFLYRLPSEQQYTTFFISKKSGGERRICTPITSLKFIQQRLHIVLQSVYQPKPSVQGFTIGRNIVSNAERHSLRKFVLNIDLKDFFPSINFGRVRGMFIAIPHNLPENVATILAQICCFNNELAQGAPTSPIISNMICSKMDSQMQRLAKRYRCIYTRYADDITFSSWGTSFPPPLAILNSDPTGSYTEIGLELQQIVRENGFEINFEKIRLQTNKHRQEVTGLVVNKFPNVKRKQVRQIRAMLHAWEKFGLENAQREYENKYNTKHRSPFKDAVPPFTNIVRGKIEFLGMVRGKDDKIYLRYLRKYKNLLNPGLSTDDVLVASDNQIFLSYARKDGEFAYHLAASFSNAGAKIWLDINDIPVGMNWGNAIQEGLDKSQIMVLVISPESMQSTNVENEWQYFLDQNKPLIPILYRPTRMHFQLQRLQYIDFHKQDYDSALAKLKRELAKKGIKLS